MLNVENGRVEYSGYTARLTCDEGYYSSGGSVVTCTNNTWNAPFTNCTLMGKGH